ncbi:hypothetical protein STRDD12_01296 [Streptococcus sp. DD12]|nr:hypothetical protein STRDD12_01296 [Streptococcus sp. DD12]
MTFVAFFKQKNEQEQALASDSAKAFSPFYARSRIWALLLFD